MLIIGESLLPGAQWTRLRAQYDRLGDDEPRKAALAMSPGRIRNFEQSADRAEKATSLARAKVTFRTLASWILLESASV
jgi:hypothetical protein